MYKRLCLYFAAALFSMEASAQNLVNNPGFENVNANCASIQGAGYINLIDWHNPDPGDSCSTPDWFATCLNNIFPTHAPNSQMGYQQPHGGSAYAGFISYDQSTGSYREYVEGSLSSPLLATKKYKISFYISLADKSFFSVNHLGIYFSNTQVTTTLNNCPELWPLAYTPQVDSNFTLTDTTNWTALHFQYTATGGEQYFTIGNFHNDANTTATSVPHAFSLQPFAYYFIDDVAIVQDTAAVDTTADTTAESVIRIDPNSAVLKVYPVPAGSDVTIEHSARQTIAEISILNSLGQLVYSNTVNSTKATIQLSGFANGMYMIRARTAVGVLVRRLEIAR